MLTGIISNHSGKKIKELERDMERDYFMSPNEAKEYGLIDHVVEKR